MAFGQEGYSEENVHGFSAEASSNRAGVSANVESDFMVKVYGWMTFGLFITGFVAFVLSLNIDLVIGMLQSRLHTLLIFGELGLVIYLSSRITKMSSKTAGAMFFVYSVLNGLTLAPIFLLYTGASIASTFVICSATFGATAMYGYTTKKDLSGMGSYLMMALIGLIIASVVNMFMASPAVYWASTYIGVIVFVLLTAYDTQKIKGMAAGVLGDAELAEKASIMGALALYLDFINLFLYLLRIFGGRRR